MEKKIIAVIGATGLQGKGVIKGLLQNEKFIIRAITRNPDHYSGKAHEVALGDLTKSETLAKAFENVYGVFAVTNFWERGGTDEMAQGTNAINAAKKAGVKHFIWSTLPNVEMLSEGKLHVPHFTGKAKVDDGVRNAGFEYYTFVQAPFYFQNLSGMLSPQPREDGSLGWALPIDPSKKVIHMADIDDLGKVVAGAFLNPEKSGKGAYLSLAAGLFSFNEVLEAFKANGKEINFNQVPEEVFSNFFEGAYEIAQTFKHFELHTYMGPNSDEQIRMAKEMATGPFTSLQEWIKNNTF